jgi:ubiquinone/menaquinone biosynthesis C-methylase UbiE
MLFQNPKYYIWKTRILKVVNPKGMQDVNNYIKGKSVLDIGCGPSPAYYSFGIAQTVVGVDISKKFVHHSRLLAENSPGFKNNYFYVNAGASNLPFKDKQFQVCLFVFTIHHIPINHALLINEAIRCCSEKVIIIDHVQDKKGLRKFVKSMWWKHMDRGIQYNTHVEWQELLKNYNILHETIAGFPLNNVYQVVISADKT